MKQIFAFLLLVIFSFSFDACKKEDTPEPQIVDASITGLDARLCGCCGGFFIEISGTTHRFLEIPVDSDFEFTALTNFPVAVRVRWHEMENACLGDEVVLDLLELR